MRPLAIVGPTASGKSALALELARKLGDVELVSIDSMQVYRGMDIGTAKPTAAEQAEIPHHLIDIVDPTEDFALAEFQKMAKEVIADIASRGKRAILVGGTGLYVQAIVSGLELPGQFPELRKELEVDPNTAAQYLRLQELDPQAAANMESNNSRRIVRALEVTIGSGRPFSSYGPGVNQYPDTPFQMIGVWVPRDVGRLRISHRVKEMVELGWVDEVRELKRRSGLSRTAAQALGYKELLSYLERTHMSPDDSNGAHMLPHVTPHGMETEIKPVYAPEGGGGGGEEVPSKEALSEEAANGETSEEITNGVENSEESVALSAAIEEIVRRTRTFARRQRVWFRRDPRVTWYATPSDPSHLLPALLRDCQE